MNGGRNYQHLPWWGWAWQDCSSSSFQVFQGPLCGLPSGASEWLLRALRVMVGDGLALVTAIPGSYSNPQEPNLLRWNSPTRFCNQKDAEKEHLSNYYFRAGLHFNLHLNLRGCYKSIECHHYWISFKKHLQETSIFDGEKNMVSCRFSLKISKNIIQLVVKTHGFPVFPKKIIPMAVISSSSHPARSRPMGRSSILPASWCVGPCSMWVCNPGRDVTTRMTRGWVYINITSIKIKKRNGEREREIMIDIERERD